MSNPNGDGKDHQRIAFYLRMMEDLRRKLYQVHFTEEDKHMTVLEVQSRIKTEEKLFFKDETLSRRLREMRENGFVVSGPAPRPTHRGGRYQVVKGWKLTPAGRRLASLYKPGKTGKRAAA